MSSLMICMYLVISFNDYIQRIEDNIEKNSDIGKTSLKMLLFFVGNRLLIILTSFKIKGENREIVYINYKKWLLFILFYIGSWAFLVTLSKKDDLDKVAKINNRLLLRE